MLRVILTFWWCLVVFWLLGGESPQAQSQTAPNSPAVSPLFDWPREVKGFGLNAAAARTDALEQARNNLAAFLRYHGLDSFHPDTAFVEASLLDGPGQPGQELQLDKVGVAKTWIFQMKSPNVAELRRFDRLAIQQKVREQQQARLEERLWLLRRLLAAIVVLLAGLFAYIRLDEWTEGRYTRWWGAVAGRQ